MGMYVISPQYTHLVYCEDIHCIFVISSQYT
jgi:hypothetical protein